LHVVLSPGHRHEATKADELIEHAQGRAFVADTGYDSDHIRNALRRKRIKAVIKPNPSRKKKPRLDRRLYDRRYLVECFFHQLKRFRAIATRYEKTARNYGSLVNLVCACLWL
jgi:transposase